MSGEAERGSTDGREAVGEGGHGDQGNGSGRARRSSYSPPYTNVPRTSRGRRWSTRICVLPCSYFRSSMATLGRFRAARLDDQRTEEDRRAQTRSGRRQFDPQPTCPSCGLAIERPHGSDADCIAALQDVIAAHRRKTFR